MNSRVLLLSNPLLESNTKQKRALSKIKEPSQKREDPKNQLETMVTDFSTFSISKAASVVGFSPTLVNHILHDDLHVKPYKYQERHKLEEYDYEKRLKFAQWFLLRPQNRASCLLK